MKLGTTRILPWLALLACGCQTEPTNTGYVGTWSRGSGEVRSTLAIVRDGEAYRVRWQLATEDGKRTVNCDWEGACEEFVEGELVARFTLTPTVDAQSGNLEIECRGTVFKPEEGEMHFLDELTVRARGKKMVAHTLEEAGQNWSRGDGQPRRIFDKIQDDVDDPPRPSVPRG